MVAYTRDAARINRLNTRGVAAAQSDGPSKTQRSFTDSNLLWPADEQEPRVTTYGRGYPAATITGPIPAGDDNVRTFTSTPASPFVELALAIAGNVLTFGVNNIYANTEGGVFATKLHVDGRDQLSEITAEKPQLNTNEFPGTYGAASGVGIGGLAAPLVVGRKYVLKYKLSNLGPSFSLFTGSGSPFDFVAGILPTTEGEHSVVLTAANTNVGRIVTKSDVVTFDYMRLYEAEFDIDLSTLTPPVAPNNRIDVSILAGNNAAKASTFFPVPGSVYVDNTNGSDTIGTGSYKSPYKTPAHAIERASPGDNVYLMPGTYPPIALDGASHSGTAGNSIKLRAMPGQPRSVQVQADLHLHEVNGGPGVPANLNDNLVNRDAFYAINLDHFEVHDIIFRDAWRSCMFFVGTVGEEHGNVLVRNCLIFNCGSAAILACGQNPDTVLPLGEELTPRTINYIIEYNDVSRTTVMTDYTNKGGGDGDQEAISIATGIANVITRYNDVHDTLQYGIDYKAGVRGGAIYGNRVWNVERYGVYLDSGRRFVSDIDIYDNFIYNCQIGIALAREAAPAAYAGGAMGGYAGAVSDLGAAEFVQTLSNIRIWNNVMYDMQQVAFYFHRHPRDGDDGVIEDIICRFNTCVDCNKSGTGRDINLSGWDEFTVVSNVQFQANLVSNRRREVEVLDTFTGQPWATITENTYTDVSPKYEQDDGDLAERNYRLRYDATERLSPVSAGLTVAPFDVDILGRDRTANRTVGAYA